MLVQVCWLGLWAGVKEGASLHGCTFLSRAEFSSAPPPPPPALVPLPVPLLVRLITPGVLGRWASLAAPLSSLLIGFGCIKPRGQGGILPIKHSVLGFIFCGCFCIFLGAEQKAAGVSTFPAEW